MVSAHLLVSISSSPFTKPLGIALSIPITIAITITFMFHSFNSLTRFKYLSLILLPLIFTLWFTRMAKSMIQQVLIFYWQSVGLVFWIGLGGLFVLHNPRNFVHLILQNRFWILNIPFGSMVKFQFFALFPMDHLPHPFVSSLILLLH